MFMFVTVAAMVACSTTFALIGVYSLHQEDYYVLTVGCFIANPLLMLVGAVVIVMAKLEASESK